MLLIYMASIYYYYVGNPSNIVTLVATLNTKILSDLELPFSLYTSTLYNNTTQSVEITYSSPLDKHNSNILNNLANIILFNGIIGEDAYVVDQNSFNRRSLGVINPPTINSDNLSGYSIGSTIITTNNVIYTCTNNTTGNAKWTTLNSVNSATLPFVTSFNLASGAVLESANNQWTVFSYFVYKGTLNDNVISSIFLVAYTTRNTTWYRFRLRNVASGQILSTSTQNNIGTQASPDTIAMTTITNLPTVQTLLSIDLLATNSTGNASVTLRSSIGIYTVQVIG